MVTSTNNENITQSCSKGVTLGVLDGDNIERTLVPFNVHELSNTSRIVTLGKHDHGSNFELNNFRKLSSGNINLDRVIYLGIRVGVTEGASIVGNGHRDLIGRDVHLVDTAKLVGSLFAFKTVKDETSLDIKQKTETISGLFEFNDIHETSREARIGTDLSVNLDTTFHGDLHAFLVGQSILKTITKDDIDGNTFTFLVGTGGRLGGPDTAHFPEIPMPGGMEALQMFLRSARHRDKSFPDKRCALHEGKTGAEGRDNNPVSSTKL
mmetsp:Transcript_28602/g.43924  ORF Transcript_28602/g.43924 Transcript_28602/m.43924 type:complete len:266 (-) Transcript_28602:12-809(-)